MIPNNTLRFKKPFWINKNSTIRKVNSNMKYNQNFKSLQANKMPWMNSWVRLSKIFNSKIHFISNSLEIDSIVIGFNIRSLKNKRKRKYWKDNCIILRNKWMKNSYKNIKRSVSSALLLSKLLIASNSLVISVQLIFL